jgi:hypothetical protein
MVLAVTLAAGGRLRAGGGCAGGLWLRRCHCRCRCGLLLRLDGRRAWPQRGRNAAVEHRRARGGGGLGRGAGGRRLCGRHDRPALPAAALVHAGDAVAVVSVLLHAPGGQPLGAVQQLAGFGGQVLVHALRRRGRGRGRLQPPHKGMP